MLVVSIVVAAILLIIGLVLNDPGVLGNMVIISIMLIAAPQLIMNYIAYKDVRDMESYFPSFLRDLVESTRAGLPLHKAIVFVRRTNYGALSKEIKKMANQLSWNVNILKVLQQFQKRVGKSRELNRAVRVIIETYKAGGNIDSTLSTLASTMTTLQDTHKERKTMLNQYVIAMYAISLVFLGIVVGINNLMVPIFETMATPAAVESPVGAFVSNPCTVCLTVQSPGCLPCNIYFGICSMFGAVHEKISCYYLALFFSMSMIQAITGGLVAGQIGEGSVRAGIKHSLILVSITFGAFFILVKLKLMGI